MEANLGEYSQNINHYKEKIEGRKGREREREREAEITGTASTNNESKTIL